MCGMVTSISVYAGCHREEHQTILSGGEGSEKRTSGLLHTMTASKDILFWTPHGQLIPNKPVISVTNIAELLEYVLLPNTNDVTKPRALNAFLDGLVRFKQEQKVA